MKTALHRWRRIPKFTCVHMAEAKKKERCANWSDNEIMILIEEVTRERKRLFQPLSSSWTAKKRGELWLAIAQRVNSVGNCRREKEQIRKKWTNLRSSTISFQSRKRHPPTGGGPPETPEWWMEKVMNILEDDCAEVMDGINVEGGESFTLVHPEVIYDSDCENIHIHQVTSVVKDAASLAPLINSEEKDMSITIPPAACASTPLRTNSSNTLGDVPSSQKSISLLGHQKKNRKISYSEKECTTKTKDRKTLQLLDSKVDRVNKETQLMDIRIKLAQTELTNARLSQMKIYYELKRVENELAIPTN